MQISQLPSRYFFLQCYVATDADEKPLRHVVEAIGDDNIVESTDYPHSDGLFPVAIEEFVRLEGVSDKTKAKILTFDWDQQIQPRLGITFQPSRELGDKLYAYLGRYYNTENKSLVRAASPTRIFTTRATFDATGRLLTEVQAANTQSKRVVPGIDPQYTDEYLLGYARPLAASWSTFLACRFPQEV